MGHYCNLPIIFPFFSIFLILDISILSWPLTQHFENSYTLVYSTGATPRGRTRVMVGNSPGKQGKFFVLAAGIYSDMGAQLKLEGVRVQVVLLPQVGLAVAPHEMVDQGHGDNQRQAARRIGADNLKQFLLFICA